MINSKIAPAAKHFGADTDLIQAMYEAEGGSEHTALKAVECSYPELKDIDAALDIFCRSANHAAMDFIKSDPALRFKFVNFFAARWAPVGTSNDPTNLNQNWAKNVLANWVTTNDASPRKA